MEFLRNEVSTSRIKRLFVRNLLQDGSNPFKSQIQRRLILRFLVAASLVSLVMGMVASYLESRRLGSQVNRRATEIVQHFNYDMAELLDDSVPSQKLLLQAKLKILTSVGRLNLGMGSVIYAGIYNLEGRPIAVEKANDLEYRDEVDSLVASNSELRKGGKKIFEFQEINNHPHILLSFPLKNSTGKEVATLAGVFVISEKNRKEMFWRTTQTVVGTIGLVLLTTMVLYPLVSTLIARQTRLADDLLNANIETLKVLGSAIAMRDCDTDIHNYRVTIYSVAIAEAIGLSNEQTRTLIKGAFVHDVGKIGISDKILLKPGRLTEEEFEIMKKHVEYGTKIVTNSSWLANATDVVSYHHEKFGGGGYPAGLKGSSIPINSRIFAIADVFDALTSERPYKTPLSYEKTMEILEKDRGNHFDPDLLDAFKGIAENLYDKVGTKSDQELQETLDWITRKYFSKQDYV